MRSKRRERIAMIYSITSSASCCIDSGTERPGAFAVLRLMASSNLVGCCTGRSAGLLPMRMRSTGLSYRIVGQCRHKANPPHCRAA
jgi:hypothetical protein